MNPLAYIRTASIEAIDPFAARLLQWEDEQQIRKLILIPSVSAAPKAVLQALGSSMQNVCAEGLPSVRMISGGEQALQDVPWQLANNRRYADRRFYKGVSYVDFAESLAKQRCAEAFAHGDIRPQDLHVSVQALSGGIANLAVYQALLQPGDTLMGMSLHEGGHLSHGSRFNLSGQLYNIVSYSADRRTERLDYDQIRDLARKHRPRLIIAGYTAYPWSPDWGIFRRIADEVGAYFMADIAHTAGLITAGVLPSPVGIADVVSLTTNKTLCGPRSAAVLTMDRQLAERIEAAVFPGQQGAPHPNKFVAVAVAFEIARTEAFRRLQRQTVLNAAALARSLSERGIRIVSGGTDTHLFLVDLKSIEAPSGHTLYGEPAARILELAGIIVNKNSIAGDREAALATGLRMGTPWLSQRGLQEADMDTLAGLIHRLLAQIHPFAYNGLSGILPRGKVALEVLEEVRAGVDALIAKTNDFQPETPAQPPDPARPAGSFTLKGWRARPFLQGAATANIAGLQPGAGAAAFLLDRHGRAIDQIRVERETPAPDGQDRYRLIATPANAARVSAWLRALSDGYALFDETDVHRKIEGPVTIEPARSAAEHPAADVRGTPAAELFASHPDHFDRTKPYFIGRQAVPAPAAPADGRTFAPVEAAEEPLQRTALWEMHKQADGRLVPFAGWEMPLRYTSVVEEHRSVRRAAGLFDVAHMGIFEISGRHAAAFLDVVLSNYVAWLEDGQACYGYLLDPAGDVIDDAIVYRLNRERFLMVVNAANEKKAWEWLQLVNRGRAVIDAARPWIRVEAQTEMRDLKAPQAGPHALRDLALQGPASLPVLQALTDDPGLKFKLRQLARNSLLECELGGFPAIAARTGYTGEEWGFELFVHPEHLPALWQKLLAAGEPHGVKPAGLGARDSTRIEAGLPLYGHELAGEFNLNPVEAGFPGFVKYHKPFFIGREALLSKEKKRSRTVIRFTVDRRRTRMPHLGDPILSSGGETVGRVTSCSINGERQLIGLAWVKLEYAAPGTRLALLPLSGRGPEKRNPAGKQRKPAVPIIVQARFPGEERPEQA